MSLPNSTGGATPGRALRRAMASSMCRSSGSMAAGRSEANHSRIDLRSERTSGWSTKFIGDGTCEERPYILVADGLDRALIQLLYPPLQHRSFFRRGFVLLSVGAAFKIGFNAERSLS